MARLDFSCKRVTVEAYDIHSMDDAGLTGSAADVCLNGAAQIA